MEVLILRRSLGLERAVLCLLVPSVGILRFVSVKFSDVWRRVLLFLARPRPVDALPDLMATLRGCHAILRVQGVGIDFHLVVMHRHGHVHVIFRYIE